MALVRASTMLRVAVELSMSGLRQIH